MERAVLVAVAWADLILCTIAQHIPELITALAAGVFVGFLVVRR